MEFREALIEILNSKNFSPLHDDFSNIDDLISQEFEKICENDVDFVQLENYRTIIEYQEDTRLGSAIFGAYLKSINKSDFEFEALALELDNLSSLLEKKVSCYVYAYFMSCFLDYLAKCDKKVAALEIPQVRWVKANNYIYKEKFQPSGDHLTQEEFSSLATNSLTFGVGRFVNKLSEFEFADTLIKGQRFTILKKYKGKGSFAIIPKFVTIIGEEAFKDNTNLKVVTIPDSVASIGQGAFSGCKNLTTVHLSTRVNQLKSSTFENCSNLKHIGLSRIGKVGVNCFKDCKKLEKVSLSNLRFVENNAFENCISLNDFSFVQHLIAIGKSAFSNTKIKNVTLKEACILQDAAFYGCTNLKEISISKFALYPENEKVSPFKSCCNVEAINIENSMPCKLYELFENDANEFINKYDKISSITVSNLKEGEFENCTNIKSVVVTDGQIIPDAAFKNCKNLEDIEFINKIKEVHDECFLNCEKLKDIKIELATDNIGIRCFAHCRSIDDFSFLDPVIKFDEESLMDTNLVNFDFSRRKSTKKIEQIGLRAFADSTFPDKLVCDFTTTTVGDLAFKGATNILSITAKSGLNSSILNKFYENIQEFDSKVKIDFYIVNGNLKPGDFENCRRIKAIYFETDDGNIPENVFKGSSVSSVTINGKVKSISDSAFANCSDLTVLDMEYDDVYVGNNAFESCKNVDSLININKVRHFGDYSFKDTDIKEIRLNTNVTYIGKGAFENCKDAELVSLPFIGASSGENSGLSNYFGYIFGEAKTGGASTQSVTVDKKKYYLQLPNNINKLTVLSETLNEDCLTDAPVFEEIDLPNIVIFDKNVFGKNDKLKVIRIGKNLEKFSCSTIQDTTNFDKFVFDSECPNFKVVNGSILSKDGKALYFLNPNDDFKDYSKKVEVIESYAIIRAPETLEISTQVDKLAEHAINCSNVRKLIIKSINNPKPEALYKLNNVKEIYIEEAFNIEKFFEASKNLDLEKLEINNSNIKSLKEIFATEKSIHSCEDATIKSCKLYGNMFTGIERISKLDIYDSIDESLNDIFRNLKVSSLNVNSISQPLVKYFNNKNNIPTEITFKKGHIFKNYLSDVNLKIVNLLNAELIDIDAFANSQIDTLHIEHVDKIAQGSFHDASIKNIIIDDQSKYMMKDDVLTSESEIIYIHNKDIAEFTIPKKIRFVNKNVICNLNSLNKLKIESPNTLFEAKAIENCPKLKVIDTLIFANEKLADIIDKPHQINEVIFHGQEVKPKFFANLLGLKRVINKDPINKFGYLSFYNDESLEYVDIFSATVIDDYAFCNCKKLDITTLNPNTELLGYNAFFGIKTPNQLTFRIDDNQIDRHMTFKDIFKEAPRELHVIGKVIPANYFENCVKLQTINFENDIERINDFAFKNCTGLTNVVVPDTVKILGNNIFDDCKNIAKLTVPFLGSTKKNAFKLSCLSNDLSNLQELTIKNGAFAGMDLKLPLLTKVTLNKEDVKVIPKFAFDDLPKLETVVGLEGVEEIHERAFENCPLLNISDLSNAKAIEPKAFYGCSSITNLILSDKLMWIGELAFGGTKVNYLEFNWNQNFGSLAEIGIQPKFLTWVKYTGKELFYGLFKGFDNLQIVELNENINKIPSETFKNCSSLETINLDNIEEIHNSAFENCTNLKIQEGKNFEKIVEIGELSFKNTSINKELVFKNNVEIGKNAFENTQLTKVKFEGDADLKDSAFENCTSLTDVESLDFTTTTLGTYVFKNCSNLKSIKFYKLINNGVLNFDRCSDLGTIDIKTLTSTKKEFVFPPVKKLENLSIGVQSLKLENICDISALQNVKNLKLYNGVLTKEFVKGLQNIECIELIDSMEKIPDNLLASKKKLRKIDIPNIKIVGAKAFEGCTNLNEINLKDAEIIKDRAFSLCPLKNLELLKSNITEIGESAFEATQMSKIQFLKPVIIHKEAFVHSKIKAIDIKDKIVKVGVGAFLGTTLLKDIQVDKIEELAQFAFYASGIQTVKLNPKIKKIPKECFSCLYLSDIKLNEGLEEIESFAFEHTRLNNKLDLPKSILYVGESIFNGGIANQITVDSSTYTKSFHKKWNKCKRHGFLLAKTTIEVTIRK